MLSVLNGSIKSWKVLSVDALVLLIISKQSEITISSFFIETISKKQRMRSSKIRMCYDRITVLPSLATPVLLKKFRFDFSQKSVTKGCFGSHIFRRTFPFALKFDNLLHLRLNYHCCKNERYSISRKKAQFFESQI